MILNTVSPVSEGAFGGGYLQHLSEHTAVPVLHEHDSIYRDERGTVEYPLLKRSLSFEQFKGIQ